MCVQSNPVIAVYYFKFYQQLLDEGLEGDALVATVYAFVVVSTIILGVIFLLAAKFKAGQVLQQFPPSVICSYLGCLGYVIVKASLSLAAGGDISNDYSKILEPKVVITIVTGATFLALRAKLGGFLSQVLPVFALTGAFYVYVLVCGLDLASLRDLDWVYPQPEYQPFTAVYSVDFRMVSCYGFSNSKLEQILF